MARSLKDTVDQILNRGYFLEQPQQKYKVCVYLPVQPCRDIYDGSSSDTGTQLHNKLSTLSRKLEEAIEESDTKKKCTILNGIFGADFEIPKDSDKASNSGRVLATHASAGIVGTSQGA